MTATFYTPAPVTLGGMHFVFYFVPQFVGETFDNIPQFYVDVIEKKEPDNQQRLYVACKFSNECLSVDYANIEQAVEHTVQEFFAYMKKCFNKVLSVVETMPSKDGAGIISVEAMVRCLYKRKCKYDNGLLNDHYISVRETGSGNLRTVDVIPGLLSGYDFKFNHTDVTHVYSEYVIHGKCTVFGHSMFFSVLPTSDCHMEMNTLRRFISPGLVKETVNASIRRATGITHDDRVYVDNVEIEEEA